MGEGQKAAHLWKIVPFHVLKSRLLYTRICFYQLISQGFYTVNKVKQKEKALAFRNVFAFFKVSEILNFKKVFWGKSLPF